MKTKLCSKCGPNIGPKPMSEFNWKNKSRKTLQPYCRECNATRSKQYYLENKQKHLKAVAKRKSRIKCDNTAEIIEYLSTHPCVDCGEDNIVVLDFDHDIPSEKKDSVTRLVEQGYPWRTILEEINKCHVRCANCHRIRTAKQLNSPRLLWWEQQGSNLRPSA